MRELNTAGYAVEKLQNAYNEGRESGLDHNDAIVAAANRYDVETFKVASLVRGPEQEARRLAENAR